MTHLTTYPQENQCGSHLHGGLRRVIKGELTICALRYVSWRSSDLHKCTSQNVATDQLLPCASDSSFCKTDNPFL